MFKTGWGLEQRYWIGVKSCIVAKVEEWLGCGGEEWTRICVFLVTDGVLRFSASLALEGVMGSTRE